MCVTDQWFDRQWNLIVQDRLVIRKLQEIKLLRYFELFPERLLRRANSHLQRPTNPDNKDRGMLPQNARLTLLAREIRIHLENILRMEELNMLRQIGIAKILEPREQGLREFFRAHDNFPDFADD